MAANRAPSAPRIALAALNAAAAVGLVRVLGGAAWLVPAVLAAVLPHALFGYSDRRRWSPFAALVAICAIGTVFAMVFVDPGTTFLGFPTTATLHAFANHVGLSTHVLRTVVVPVPPVGAALSLSLLSIWMVSTTADWLLARLDATLGAVGPSLVLFVAVGALGKGSQWPTTFLYGAAVAGFLLAVHYDEMVDRRTWFHLPRRRRSRYLTGGAAAAAGAVLLALVLGPLLPGARSDAWFNYRGLGTSRGGGTWHTVTPLVDIRARLVDQSDTELFTVKAPQAAYWRMVALDSFNGQVWGLQADAPSAGAQLGGATEPPSAERLTQQFHIEALSTRWLPAAYQATKVSPRTNTLWIPDSVSLVTSSATSDGAQYTVVSEIPTPSIAQLRGSSGRAREPREDLALPKGFPSKVTKLAQRVTANATTPYDRALALQSYLRDSGIYTYDLNVPPGHSDKALEHFLFDSRRGYCEQFAGSFAAMARAIGLPARVAVGFTHGTRDKQGVYHVTNKEAHAWPEVWLQGIGWMPFEPTPGRFEPTPGDPTGTGKQAPQATATTATSAPRTASTAAKTGSTPTVDPKALAREFVNAGGGTGTAQHDSVGPRVLIAVAAIVALAIVAAIGLVIGVLATKWVRRRRRRRADDTRDRVTGAWAEALDRLREAGVEPRASATPVEFAMRHAAAHGAGAAGPPLMDLARLQTAALFAGEPPSDGEASAAWKHVERIEQTLRRAANRSRRWRRRLDPRSLRVPAGAR